MNGFNRFARVASTCMGLVVSVGLTGSAQARTQGTLQGDVQVKAAGSLPAGTEAAAKAAIEARLGDLSSCGDLQPGAAAVPQGVSIQLDAAGLAQAVTGKDSALPADVKTCVEGKFKDLKLEGAGGAELSFTLALAGVEAAPVVVAAPVVAAAPVAVAPAETAPAAAAADQAATVATAAGQVDTSTSAVDEEEEEEEPAAQGANQGTAPNPNDPNAQRKKKFGTLNRSKSGQRNLALENEPNEQRPWRLRGSLSLNVGQGTFVQNSFAATPLVQYSGTVGGSYRLNSTFNLTARMDFFQQLTVTNADGGSRQREFFLRELRIGAAAFNFFTEKNTEIHLDGSATLFLPTDVVSQAAERIFGLSVGLTLRRDFDHVGPGTVQASLFSSYRENVGPRQQTYSADKAFSLFSLCSAGEFCGGGPANVARQAALGLSVNYAFLDHFAFSITYQAISQFAWDLTGGDLSPRLQQTVGDRGVRSSQFGAGGGGINNISFGNVDFSYQYNANFSFSLGVSNFTDPLIWDNGWRLRFPFFDFDEPAANNTTFYSSVSVLY